MAPLESISLVSQPDSDKACIMNLESQAQDLSNRTFCNNENVLQIMLLNMAATCHKQLLSMSDVAGLSGKILSYFILLIDI